MDDWMIRGLVGVLSLSRSITTVPYQSMPNLKVGMCPQQCDHPPIHSSLGPSIHLVPSFSPSFCLLSSSVLQVRISTSPYMGPFFMMGSFYS